MAANRAPAGGAANWVLAALPPREYRKLHSSLEAVPLHLGDVLHEAGGPIRHVYFPCSGLVSLLMPLERGKAAEVGVVGREGVVGLPACLGGDAALYQALVQGEGNTLRMRADVFREQLRPRRSLSALLLRYTDAFLAQVSQSAACNYLHAIPQRYCRWLLLAQDRLGSDRLPFTQKFVAKMLAVRLASVSEAASALRRAGLIRYSRGDIRILDRRGLEAACCGCYRAIKERFDRLAAYATSQAGGGS